MKEFFFQIPDAIFRNINVTQSFYLQCKYVGMSSKSSLVISCKCQSSELFLLLIIYLFIVEARLSVKMGLFSLGRCAPIRKVNRLTMVIMMQSWKDFVQMTNLHVFLLFYSILFSIRYFFCEIIRSNCKWFF